MTQHIIGYFCGTGLEVKSDECFQAINRALNPELNKKTNPTLLKTTLFAYDGCQVHGGGLFAHGVEEQADAFIKQFKSSLKANATNYQLNLVAHSRGVLSALLVIKKIQADPDLKNKVKITADFHDPVPGNFQLTTRFVGKIASANQLADLSDCDIVKKVFITLQEKPILPLAFDALVPKFHHATRVEIEALPGYHDVQHRLNLVGGFDHRALLGLGNTKTLSILKGDGHYFKWNSADAKVLQLGYYADIARWAQTRAIPMGERDIHFGGQLIVNNTKRQQVDVVNWRHANLLNAPPSHVLYGVTHPHYNYRKTPQEHYCDLTQALDNFAAKHLEHQQLMDFLKKLSGDFVSSPMKVSTYKDRFQQLLNNADVHDERINKSFQYLCMHNDFIFLDLLTVHMEDVSPLYDNLQTLKVALYEERCAEFERGQTVPSNAIKIMKNTEAFLDKVYSGSLKPEEILKATEQYVQENSRFGRNWSMGSKAIFSALICVAAAVVGCVIGVMVGMALGFSGGSITGPGAFITACVGAFIGGLEGALFVTTSTSIALGLGVGAYQANRFFSQSPVEKEIQALADSCVANQSSFTLVPA